MSQYALVNGELTSVTVSGQRGTCHDPACAWTMFARPGNGQMIPHWAHQPGSGHTMGTGEKGEWHLELQNLFALHGAQLEVVIGEHRADVVLADGRVIEAQTGYLDPGLLTAREAVYGEMCWIWDARHDWVIDDGLRAPHTFKWGKPDRRFFVHAKPIYLDCPDGFYRLDSMSYRHVKGNKGRPVWEGTRTQVCDGVLEFVRRVSAGEQFGKPPNFSSIDPRHNKRGVKFRTPTPVDEWLLNHPTCGYEGDYQHRLIEIEPVDITPPARPRKVVTVIDSVATPSHCTHAMQGHHDYHDRCAWCGQTIETTVK